MIKLGLQTPFCFKVTYGKVACDLGKSWADYVCRTQLASSSSQRHRHSAVWDSSAKRIIVFGGVVPAIGVVDSLLEYDSITDSWSSPNATGPSARSGHLAVWDSSVGVMIMCCGSSNLDLWAYTGTSWIELQSAGSLNGRNLASAVYDPVSGYMMAFGGIYNNSQLASVLM